MRHREPSERTAMENNIRSIMEYLCRTAAFEKITFSRRREKATPEILRETAVPFRKRGGLYVQIETRCADGKAVHRNLPAEESADVLTGMAEHEYRQTDIHTSAGDCEIRFSKKNECHIVNRIRETADSVAEVRGHNRVRRYLLDPEQESAAAFLYPLGITDAQGRVLDKKRPKYRQINRFLELVDDIADELPAEDPLRILDLCCGKSYLSFAVYHYFTVLRGRSVSMIGIDRKPDVIAACGEIASSLGFGEGLTFLCADLKEYRCEQQPHLVLSLHACDTATDLVLSRAAAWGAPVILSTPCCHHEVFHKMNAPSLSFITEHSLLKQKLADAATDALRCLWLKRRDYEVQTVELIDPEETPKNLMIRAVKRKTPYPPETHEAFDRAYREACELLGCTPFLETEGVSNPSPES